MLEGEDVLVSIYLYMCVGKIYTQIYLTYTDVHICGWVCLECTRSMHLSVSVDTYIGGPDWHRLGQILKEAAVVESAHEDRK